MQRIHPSVGKEVVLDGKEALAKATIVVILIQEAPSFIEVTFLGCCLATFWRIFYKSELRCNGVVVRRRGGASRGLF